MEGRTPPTRRLATCARVLGGVGETRADPLVPAVDGVADEVDHAPGGQPGQHTVVDGHDDQAGAGGIQLGRVSGEHPDERRPKGLLDP